MISYPIQAAQKSGLFDHIIVSTDDKDIASIAKNYGAEIPFIRPAELADDFTGTIPVTNHAIQWLQDHGTEVDYVCCIYATTPLLQSFYLEQGFERLKDSDKLFAFSACTFPFPVQRALRKLENGGNEPMWPEYIGSRSQDLEEAIHDAGQFYWGTADAFLKGHNTFSPESMPVLLPRYLVQDIDTEEDWQYAEYMFEILKKHDFNID
jgi:N-acylneuraminate cytidylyltransferase